MICPTRKWYRGRGKHKCEFKDCCIGIECSSWKSNLTTAPEPEPGKEKEEVSFALMKMHFQQDARRLEEETSPAKDAGSGSRPALKDDPKYARYFRMLKVGMLMDVVKHAMTRDDLDPSVMDGDQNKPAGGIPLKSKVPTLFKMLAIGLPM
jgi:hypothetical protein